jgi:hypothetical protein
MIIPIDGKYRLKSDVNQWMLQRSKIVKNPDTGEKEIEWQSFKYFHDPSNAVNALVQMLIRSSDAATLVDALDDAKNVTSRVLAALNPHFEVKEKV